MKVFAFVLGCGLVGVAYWLRYRETHQRVSEAWLTDQHRWATDRSAQYDGVCHHGKFWKGPESA